MTDNTPAMDRQPWFELRDLAPISTLFALLLFFSLTTKDFLSFGVLRLVLQQGAVLAIVATGLTFVLICGEIDLSVGMVALWTACLCGVLFESPWAAGKGGERAISLALTLALLLAPLATSLILGWISGFLTVRSGLPSFIITLAMMNIADGASRFLTKSEKFAVPALLTGEHGLGNGELKLVGGLALPYSALFAAFILLIGHIVLQHTRFGRYVYMTGANREAARLAGVRIHRTVITCLALCALTAGLGGLVNAGRLESVSLDQNADLLLSAVACVVLGGTSLFGGEGGIPQTVLGVLSFTILKVGLNQLDWKIQDFDLMRPLLMGLVLLAALVLHGLLARHGSKN